MRKVVASILLFLSAVAGRNHFAQNKAGGDDWKEGDIVFQISMSE